MNQINYIEDEFLITNKDWSHRQHQKHMRNQKQKRLAFKGKFNELIDKFIEKFEFKHL